MAGHLAAFHNIPSITIFGSQNPNLSIPPDTTFQFLAISDSVTVPQAADASHQQGLPGPTWMQIGA